MGEGSPLKGWRREREEGMGRGSKAHMERRCE